ncbi:hypothetical protein HaLaN_17316 [Haematococcus lacustris]|uniref:Uncharacterized protein n=1 Tax=Haematococcus lacustris TaxID=44745 RepID=A0A699ZC04_HAELA|nr:hypothetical protein HaLaN_17316 [Haematococcus lacustris]
MARLKSPSTPRPGASKLEVHGQEDLRYKELNSVLFAYLRVGLDSGRYQKQSLKGLASSQQVLQGTLKN